MRTCAALARQPQKQSTDQNYITHSRYIYHYGPASDRKFGYLDIEEVDADEASARDDIETLVGEYEEAPADYKPRTTSMPTYTTQRTAAVRLGPIAVGHAQRLAEKSVNSSTAMKRSFSEQQTCDLEPLEGAEVRTKRARSEEPSCVKRVLLDDSMMDLGE